MLAAPIPALRGRGTFRWLSAEPKYDGYRVLLRYDGRCVVQSRRGTDLSRSFPDLIAAAVEQIPDETILDREVVVGVDGRLHFAELQKRVASPARAASLAWAGNVPGVRPARPGRTGPATGATVAAANPADPADVGLSSAVAAG